MTAPKKRLLLVIASLLPIICFCQAKKEVAKDSIKIDSTKKNVFSASINYQNRLHYFGRVDSLKSGGIFPSIGLEFKNGLFATSSFIFVQNAVQSATYGATIIQVGYNFPESDTIHFTGNIFFNQFLYKDNSELVQSALKSQTGFNASYTNRIVNITVGGDLKFSDNIDIGATAVVDHLFIYKIRKKKMAIAFNPSFQLQAGTQQFSSTYIRHIASPLPALPGSSQQVTERTTSFNILAYEFSAPIVFVAGKFNASITPSYVMPQHMIAGETGSNLFYLTFSTGIRL